MLRALGSASCDITHETGDTICDITHEPRARFVAVLIVCWNTKKQHVCDSFLTLKTLQLSKQDEFLQDRSIVGLGDGTGIMCVTISLPCQQITDNKPCILPCLTQKPENHRQQVLHLVMPRTDTSKSQATNRTSFYAPHRCQQITGNKSYILQRLIQTPANRM